MRRALRALLAAAVLLPAASSGASDDDGWERYLKRTEILRQQRDKGNHDEAALLKVLREAGVLTLDANDGGTSSQSSYAAGFRPFKVRVYGGMWRWPLKAGVVSSEYGRRWGRRHDGIDIAADEGDLVYAAAPGEVIYSGSELRGYGNVIVIRHDEKTTSLYAHNSSLRVKKGETVRGGDLVATVGSTGRSTGPHVHFELRRKKKALDPRKLLPKTRF
ncbi:MAG: M23 family metallopeptidase [Elusimicrobia bacterium]|nr:M23 family metallopeptidase [Elusimicrobiota bacterium]